MATYAHPPRDGAHLGRELDPQHCRENYVADGAVLPGDLLEASGNDLKVWDGVGTIVGVAFNRASDGELAQYHARGPATFLVEHLRFPVILDEGEPDAVATAAARATAVARLAALGFVLR